MYYGLAGRVDAKWRSSFESFSDRMRRRNAEVARKPVGGEMAGESSR